MTVTDVYQSAHTIYTLIMPWADKVTAETVTTAAATLPGAVYTCVVDRDRRLLTVTAGWDACFDCRSHFLRLAVIDPYQSTMSHLDGRRIGGKLI